MNDSRLRASQLREVLQQYGEALAARRKGLDKLNVYPVPDGDTGTNMSLTVASVIKELKTAAADDMASVAAAVSKGAIMGARGNSGAILAQALRGIAESAKGKTTLGPADLADALDKARSTAYDAVLKPVEGTILTVITAAAQAARKSADEGHKLKEQLESIRAASADALARTPELLPALKQAGVVDAGGSGFLLFVDALRFVATGEPIPSAADAVDAPEAQPAHGTSDDSSSDLRYEVMFLLENANGDIQEFRTKWGDVGDSIVVIGGDGFWNCHIHSNDIGASIEIALDFGRPSEIRVTDLQEQVSQLHGEEPQQETAVVAVLEGHALEQTYRSFGVTRIVRGGQSANPSVEELLAAVEAAPSDSVIVLPNNKNIHAAAEQVAALTDKRVAIIATSSPVVGLSALVSYVPDRGLDENLSDMTGSANQVVAGQVTRAVRDALSEAGPITTGDWIGIGSSGIASVSSDAGSALIELVDALVMSEHSLLTVVEGQDCDKAHTESLRAWMSENRADIEVQVYAGGQPLYPFMIAIE